MKENGKKERKMGKVYSFKILGVEIYAFGGKYDGEWKNDLKNGKGINGFKYRDVLFPRSRKI